jgi:hypothetical protein
MPVANQFLAPKKYLRSCFFSLLPLFPKRSKDPNPQEVP